MDLDHLPHHVKLSILLYLDYKSIVRMTAVAKGWLGLVSPNQPFWRQKFELDFGEWGGGEVDFEREYKIEYGLRFREPRIVDLEGQQHYMCGLSIKGSKMALWSMYESVHVWDLDKMEHLCEFKEEEALCAACDGEMVFTGLDNGEIHMWDLHSRELVQSWKAHGGCVFHLSLAQNHLVSGDSMSLRIWDISTLECIQKFEMGGVKRIHVDGDEMICGLYGKRKVCVFHAEDGLLYTLDVGKAVRYISANASHIFVGDFDGNVQVWNKTNKECVETLNGGNGTVVGLLCIGRQLVSLTSEGYMEFWDLDTFVLTRQIEVGLELASCMDYDNGRFVVASYNGWVRVLDFA